MPDVHNGAPTRDECHRAVVLTLSRHDIGGRWPAMLAAIAELTDVLHTWTQRAHGHGFDEGVGCLIAQALAAIPTALPGGN